MISIQWSNLQLSVILALNGELHERSERTRILREACPERSEGLRMTIREVERMNRSAIHRAQFLARSLMVGHGAKKLWALVGAAARTIINPGKAGALPRVWSQPLNKKDTVFFEETVS